MHLKICCCHVSGWPELAAQAWDGDAWVPGRAWDRRHLNYNDEVVLTQMYFEKLVGFVGGHAQHLADGINELFQGKMLVSVIVKNEVDHIA